ncbi:MAG TPA: hypothetical protein VJP02_27425 [Candidatus Sulfotelmatobacter sp.]|nr:hypothetical protein [Candidatus Sulfotelmatobacter sp.]
MPLDALDQKTLKSLPRLSDVHTSYGVEVNALSINQLFALYERTGFLYPGKAARLTPHLGQVRENWRRMLRGGESLLYVVSSGNQKSGLASIAVWRTTHHGWMSQHLVSENNPLASRAVMLAGTASSILRGADESYQNWFRPENRFPSRVFGSMVQTIGTAHSSVQQHMYFALSRRMSLPSSSGVRVVAYDASHKEALGELARTSRGQIYVTAEELALDVELKAVDELYRNVGLRRTRQVWLAYPEGKNEPIGAAVAYRGPLGANFSFLENRCDLLLHPKLAESEASNIVTTLLQASFAAYEDFELDAIPVIADPIASVVLIQLGAEYLRDYCQGIWLKGGNLRFYRHIDGFYSRLLSRSERHAMEHSFAY